MRAIAAPQLLTVRAAEGEWHELLEGVAVKQLYVDAERGTVTSLFKLQPGASLPIHFHAGTEECLVLEGDLRTDEIVLHRGDYHCAPKGSRHPLIMSVTGALLLIVAQASPEARVV
ncbi:MAG: cupin domain-containing protein [Acidobacteriota bacterium]|nr:cupin domain-containing protein [Acidobacteriota bacterium]